MPKINRQIGANKVGRIHSTPVILLMKGGRIKIPPILNFQLVGQLQVIFCS